MLVQIDAGYYCAGLVVDKDNVVVSAPILRWCMGRDWESLRKYFIRKGFKVTKIPDNPGE